ncbi:putative bifunctional diguanylate cyclase/phosphodiesterase [Dactylosporangium sp. NPDC051541]|uniref:putative bifunctional diguanylate cyclase/phosphodiesterase n=1 Tax=Dactylosporangium sp. NPDC051541 TaxID=3363977 RepID=UPI00379EF28C
MRIWLWFLIGGAALAAVAALTAPGGSGPLNLVLLAVFVAVAAGAIARRRPQPRAAWWLLFAGVAASATSTYLLALMPDGPEELGAGYFLCYPLTAAGLWLVAKRLRPWSSTRILDAGIVLIGIAQLNWIFVLYPLLHRSGLKPLDAWGVSLIAVSDLVTIALLLRFAFAARRSPAALLVLAAVGVMVSSDAFYVIKYVAGHGTASISSFSAVGWLVWALLLATAALHPDAGTALLRPRAAGADHGTPIAGFIALSLLGPGLLMADLMLRPGADPWRHALVPAILTGALMVSMVLRLGRALRERTKLQQELAFRAQHDVLTGLANRELFRSSLQDELDAHREIGLLIIDLDGFKDVNDTLGHPAGDELLLTASARLRATATAASLLARLGGDEFAVICPPGDLDDIAAALVRELALPYRVAGREQRISASIGVYSGHPVTTGDALQSADIALYAAKEAGRNRAVRYHPALREAHVAHTVLADQLRAAVEAGAYFGFSMHYQPVVDVQTGRVTAVEALLRFTTPDGTPVSPAVFVPVAEEIGLIGKLGAWVLEQACTDAKVWHDEHGISVTVNVSGRQLRNPKFADEVLAVLKRTGLPGAALVLEITETVLVTASLEETAEVSRRLARLRAFGIRIAIDDFGTGYSSLAYLRTLPLDVLKIDRAFVHRIEERQDKALFRAVVELARSMYLTPVAEGVETPGQAEVLRELDCALAQGFLHARPMPAPALATFLVEKAAVAA